ncbi:MAG: hypothetical protein HFI37_02255 [Lachnospiraceae bacterium]|nr:hypothetical protein [Lachnospiraceae bacterium]
MILNLHGLNGSRHNTNYKLLLKIYSKDKIISPQIDYENISPLQLVEDLQQYREVDCMVGSSLGGFYAYVLSSICKVPCVLVNPCIPPERYLPFLVEEYAFTKELIYLSEMYSDNPQIVYMILGMDDDLLSPSYTEQIVDFTKIWKINGGHSMAGNQQFYSLFLHLFSFFA